MIKCTRFTFGNTGLFQATELLDDADMEAVDWAEYQWAMHEFNAGLEVPDICQPRAGIKTRSFFTDEGLKSFSLALDVLYELFQKYAEAAGLGEIQERVYMIPEEDILYQDEYQVLIPEDKIVLEQLSADL